MLQRLRLALHETHSGKLSGHVEVDETLIGGKARFMHADRRAKASAKGSAKGMANKVIVAGVWSAKEKSEPKLFQIANVQRFKHW
jgi:hypothetical protein